MPSELIVPAQINELDKVIEFIENLLSSETCVTDVKMQLIFVADEIFSNISNYAYVDSEGDVLIQAEIVSKDSENNLSEINKNILLNTSQNKKSIILKFIDNGMEYNPLNAPAPDLNLPAAEREIGGLGIYLIKELVDEMKYEYSNEQNKLTVVKSLK